MLLRQGLGPPRPGGRNLRILLVDDDPARLAVLREGLTLAGHALAGQAGPRDDLPAVLRATDAGAVVASMPGPGRAAIESLGRIAAGERPRPVVMFVGEEGTGLADVAIRAGVAAYVVDGLSARRVGPVLAVAAARFAENLRLRGELERSRAALAERKLVERAKGLLMRQRGVAEEEAYRMLRKAAMDQGRRLAEVAEALIAAARMLDAGS